MTESEYKKILKAIDRFNDEENNGWHDGMMILHELVRAKKKEKSKRTNE